MSLEQMEEEIERYYINMENELLMNIAKKLAENMPMEIDKWDEKNNQPLYGSGGVNEWQLERLKELGGLTSENAEIIAKYSGKTKQQIEKVFEKAREIGTEADKDILELGIKAGVLNEINPTIEKYIVKDILNNAMRETLTTFNSENNSLLASAGNEYKKIVNNVSAEVMTGTKTIGKAIQESVTKLADKGLTAFTARNGAEWSPEAYTKMVLRTNARQTTNKIQEERMKLAGNDYIEISSHIGARPLCSEDQGKIFSLSGNTTSIIDGLGREIKVYDWSNSSYGEPAGILGINCGHSRYAFIPSISIHREQQISKAENDEAYLEKQQQRLYERTIRNKKREINMLKEVKAEDNYITQKQRQLREYNKQYIDFLKETGRTRISANEWIGTSTIKGLSVSDTITKEKHKLPVLLEEVRKINNKNINNIINKYEKTIKDDKIENAIVITKTGKVYQCFGNATNVWPDVDLGDELIEAIVTHNHPIEETNFSFSSADLNLFEKYKLSKLRGVDSKYTYELNSKKQPVLNIPDDYALKEYGYEHLMAIQYAIDNNIYYMRWKNERK